MEIKCKMWQLTKGKISGEYAVMTGTKEIACNNFNSEYGGENIGFSNDIIEKAGELSELITTSIENNFRGAE